MPVGDISRLDAIGVERARAIRARVRATGFVERTPHPAETAATGMPQELRVPLVQWALDRDAHPAAGLALLFEHLLPIPRAVADRTFGAEMLGWLLEAGIVERVTDRVRARLRLAVMDGVFIWCDDPSGGEDAVMSPGPTTLDLLTAFPSPVNGSVLDVGTGPGTLALVAAKRGADRVVATDVSERAIALTRFNAAFNELKVDARVGDLLGPVASERFDWIVAQPPYVTHPPDEPGVAFLHGGTMGDELAMRLLAGVVPRLRSPGLALVLFDSPDRPKSTLAERVRAVVGAEADIAVLGQPGLGPDRQALGYAALADPTFGDRYAQAAVRYRAHLERQRVADVMHSLVVVRTLDRPKPQGWDMSLLVARFPERWEEMREFLRSIDLAHSGDDAIAAARTRPRPGARVVIERAPGASRDAEERSVRFASPSIALDRELTQAGAVIFDLLAAEPSVAMAIDRFARAMDRPAGEVRTLVTSFVRDCLLRALLVPD